MGGGREVLNIPRGVERDDFWSSHDSWLLIVGCLTAQSDTGPVQYERTDLEEHVPHIFRSEMI